ncbi:MAG: hydroxymethylglutaryl-CoA lyase, partial [Chthoniobacterales bacterium]
ARKIAALGVASVSLADTIGAADSALIHRVVTTAIREITECEIGVHLHSTRADAASKILAAYDAGCRRFDSAVGGLGGCPFAQNDLVGNIPTEEVLGALRNRDASVLSQNSLEHVATLNAAIAAEFAG